MKRIYKLYNNKIITFDELRSVRDSYIGHLKHGNCGRLVIRNIK